MPDISIKVRNKIAQVQGTPLIVCGNLDNITVSEIRVYSSPSGLPTGVSASSVCIVETLVVDSNSAYQIITLLSNQGTAQERSYPTYKRVKVGGVWYDWKLIVS